MLGDPLLVHCFEFTAKPNEALQEAARLPDLEYLNKNNMTPVAGQPFAVQLKLTDPATGQGIDGLEDVFVFANQVAGNWNTRAVASSMGEGVYEVPLTMPRAGLYAVYIDVPSLGLDINQHPGLNLEVAAGS
jgi:hypothetical protein